ncbi:protein FAM210B, mitochondrial-like [Polyodon spathula]|uniref:protein FAM210B, mitochondrial-like n=1 Tax=Polyodon spathula TaxID=7913 RepID=UPI001B7E80AE|nr:protein FAM210B, mitochondrial-like [Polyodon spathula]
MKRSIFQNHARDLPAVQYTPLGSYQIKTSQKRQLSQLSTAPLSQAESGDSRVGAAEQEREENRKPNKSQQLKKVFKEYGAVGVVFHIGISLMSLGIFYLAISSGTDMTALLFKVGFSEALVQSKMAAGTSTFVLAYAVHKLFAPVRISITVVSVPFIVRYFRKVGLFKPPVSSP